VTATFDSASRGADDVEVAVTVGNGQLGTCAHVAATFDMPTGLHIYVDGAMTASATNVPPPALNGQPVTIGRGSFGNFAGSIDSLRIYNRALSAGEIMALSADR